MPYIDEKDLLALHEQIDREKAINNKLLDQINEKGKAYARALMVRNIAWLSFGIIIIAAAAASFYFYLEIGKTNNAYALCREKETLYAQQQVKMDSLMATRDSLQQESHHIEQESLIADVVYSVQIGAFKDLDIPLRSAWGNYAYNPTYHQLLAFSIGVYKTVDEAREFRKILVKMGFKDAFVASYQNGSRIAIESD